MPQRFRVDRAAAATYLALVLAGCTRSPGAVVPAGAAPVAAAELARWVDSTRPTGHTLHRFTWLFRDERSSAGGRGSARIAAPDSLRFDVTGPLGVGAASAVVVGDSAHWVEPPDAVERLVPDYYLLWGLFGVARRPEPGVAVQGVEDAGRTAWRYVTGSDTVAYVRTTGERARLVTEVRQGDRTIGRAETELGPDGRPRSARLVMPTVPARLDITFTASRATAPFPSGTWISRGP